MSSFVGIDWGTTNLRAWRIGAEGRPEADLDLPFGVSRLPAGGIARCFHDQVRPALDPDGRLPVLMCGMVGSNIGWKQTPYAPCPASAALLARSLMPVEPAFPNVRIVPGLTCDGIAGAPDIMRGEETQVLGWVALDPARRQGAHIICHPGTHSKWVRVENGAITRFATAMTGELFDVLSKHSILRGGHVPDDMQTFAKGVASAGDGAALSARLFSSRSRVVAGGADLASAPSFLSGLLVGAEIASLPGLIGADRNMIVHVVASPSLQKAYARALDLAGWRYTLCDGETASIAGLVELARAGGMA